MSEDNAKLTQHWNVLKEQLIALCALHKLPKGNEEFKKFLSEDLALENLNSHTLSPSVYYILGIINRGERNKLIQWPLINIITNTRFRKGVCTMVTDLQKTYPWALIRKLPESYFVTPHRQQSKVVDFVSRLANLAIHLALDDPEILLMNSGDNLSIGEINIMTEVIKKAREREEELMQDNLIPLQEVESVKVEIFNKCIVLKQGNSELQEQLKNLEKHAVSRKLIKDAEEIHNNDLKKAISEKLLELNEINNELLKYFNLSEEISHKLEAFGKQSSLSYADFGCKNLPFDLNSATARVCGELCQLFQLITQKNFTKEQEEAYYKKLRKLKESLRQQNAAFHSFLSNVSTVWDAKC